MAYVCELTGKKKLKGNRVSHANNKSIHFQQPNLQERAFYIPELKTNLRLRVSTRALRTVNKVGGISRFLVDADPEQLSLKLRRVRKAIMKKGLSDLAAS